MAVNKIAKTEEIWKNLDNREQASFNLMGNNGCNILYFDSKKDICCSKNIGLNI